MRYIFDFIIIFILISSAYLFRLILLSLKNQPEIKTKRARFFLIALTTIIFIGVFWGSFVAPKIIKTKTIEINLNKTKNKEKIKIAFLTDWHLGYYKSAYFLNRVVEKILQEKPDLVILGGDFVDGHGKTEEVIFPIKKLSTQFPTFAVMGNHEFNMSGYNDKDFKDKTPELRKFFFENNIRILDNLCVPIFIKNQKLNIAGIIDLWTEKNDFSKAYETCDPRQQTILISHNPDIVLQNNLKHVGLILSGHTHAGQIRLPFIGAMTTIPDKLGRDYDYGLFDFKNFKLYISAGLGESGTRARLFNHPELSIINIDL